MNPTRTLIVAGDPLARAGLGAVLAAEEQVIVAGQVADADDLERAVDVFRPDVVLWDSGWGASAGVERLSTFAELGVPILAIAADEAAAGDLWTAGVRGLIERSSRSDQLAAALQALAVGLVVVSRAFQPAPRPGPPPGPMEPLTPREMDVLKLMADGLPNKLIARDLAISEHTVKYHVNSILAKLGAQSRTDAVVRATRSGLLLL